MVATMDAKLNEPGTNNGIRSIVVVEDAQELADSIRYSLEHEGFRVSIANTGQAALDIILEHPPSLVLLDINVRGRGGFDWCRRFRAEAATTRVPVLILTARS